MLIGGLKVIGAIDEETRCKHYHTDNDRIAIKFKCCNQYYPCYRCHEEHCDHAVIVWPVNSFNFKAILCGSCGHELTIHEYKNCESSCPNCHASFNQGCQNHYHLYFEE